MKVREHQGFFDQLVPFQFALNHESYYLSHFFTTVKCKKQTKVEATRQQDDREAAEVARHQEKPSPLKKKKMKVSPLDIVFFLYASMYSYFKILF